MDIQLLAYKTGPLGPTALEQAEIIDGYKSIMWVERYKTPGEFKIVAPLSSNLRNKLPLGTIVSHTDTLDLMFVENHILSESEDEEPSIEITGRSFDAFLENRIVGIHQDWSANPDVFFVFELAFDYSWNQAKALINRTINSDTNFQSEEAIPYMIAEVDISGLLGYSEVQSRIVRRGNLHERLTEILALDDLGVRMIRRNNFGNNIGNNTNTLFLIHNGKDRSASVVFASTFGDIKSADYLWTNKTKKNAVLVKGRWVETRANSESPIATGYDRRVGYVSAEDIDENFTSAPAVGNDRTTVLNNLNTRGLEYLADSRQFLVTRVDISDNSRHIYRQDYDIGDIITVQSIYGDIFPMRVVEYTEIIDQEGGSGHPTLNALDY